MSNKPKYKTVRELIYWAYANLAMAHSAVRDGQLKYKMINYMIRAKLFKGLKDGTMSMRSFFDDEKVKIQSGLACSYCGSEDHLCLDHIFAKKYVFTDDAENLIYACRSCNSSKGKKDLMEWMLSKEKLFPLMVIRRYLKLIYHYCEIHKILDLPIEELEGMKLPFSIECIPTKYPDPSSLKLTFHKHSI